MVAQKSIRKKYAGKEEWRRKGRSKKIIIGKALMQVKWVKEQRRGWSGGRRGAGSTTQCSDSELEVKTEEKKLG